MPSTNPPDPLLQRLGAIEQRLQAIEHGQPNATLTSTLQLEAFIQLHTLIEWGSGSAQGARSAPQLLSHEHLSTS